MHDLHVADKIMKLVLEKARENKFTKVLALSVELGEIIEHESEINADNLTFNLEMLFAGTIAEGADVSIKKIKGPSWKLVEISGN